MDDADMDGTDISTTHISEADIDGEDMRDAEISGADIGGSDMGGDTAGAVGLVAEYRKISAEQAKEMMGGGQEYILLDVRSREEWEQSRIDGSLLIPDTLIRERASDELPDKDALILIYCRSGRRSAAAAEVLVSLGYTNVYDFGGIISWPYETTSGK
ncbi:MAG: rhodanese-like domain-containing protein [Oscillospiraceae bacterium]|nr:rhodanese-like domain-containing protein [Oscillospiraceae bacterium]